MSIKDIFLMSNTGICSKKDNIVFQDTKDSLQNILKDFIFLDEQELTLKYALEKDSRDWKIMFAKEAVRKNESNLEPFIKKAHYRPFIFKWTYYINKSKGFMAYPVYDILQHMLKENIGLICDRGSKLQTIDNIFVSDKLIDLHLVGNGSYIFPLYLHKSESSVKTLRKLLGLSDGNVFDDKGQDPFCGKDKIENLKSDFRDFIDSKYSVHFTPEEILGYIYALLYSKTYRVKYLEFLKNDFPKIIFCDDKKRFLDLSSLGRKLIDLHLMKIKDPDSTQTIYENGENNKVEKIIFNEKRGVIFVNKSLYFENVSKEVWEFKIGGYKVLDKLLKELKDRELDFESIIHIRKTIIILQNTIEIQSSIDELCDFI